MDPRSVENVVKKLRAFDEAYSGDDLADKAGDLRDSIIGLLKEEAFFDVRVRVLLTSAGFV